MLKYYFVCFSIVVFCTLQCQVSIRGYITIKGELAPSCRDLQLCGAFVQKVESRYPGHHIKVMIKNMNFSYVANAIHGFVDYDEFYALISVFNYHNTYFHVTMLTKYYTMSEENVIYDYVARKLINYRETEDSIICSYNYADIIETYMLYFIKNVLRPELRKLKNAFESDIYQVIFDTRIKRQPLEMKTFANSQECREFLVKNLYELANLNEETIMRENGVLGRKFHEDSPMMAWDLLVDCLNYVKAMKSVLNNTEIQSLKMDIPEPYEVKVIKVFNICIEHLELSHADIDITQLTIVFTDDNEQEIEEALQSVIILNNNICVPVFILKTFNVKLIMVCYDGLTSETIFVNAYEL